MVGHVLVSRRICGNLLLLELAKRVLRNFSCFELSGTKYSVPVTYVFFSATEAQFRIFPILCLIYPPQPTVLS
jgi:hypothetical protein